MNVRILNNDKLSKANALVCIAGYLDTAAPSFNKDANNVTNYVGNTHSGWSNVPASWGTLVSFRANDKAIQIFYDWNYNKIWLRFKNNNWGGWGNINITWPSS